MKNLSKIFKLGLVVLVVQSSLAQAPNAFNYQSVLRNSTGAILANQAVTLRFSIRTGTSTGTVQYQETRALTTNQFGLANHVIGTGTVVSGSMTAVTWNTGDKFLQVEVNPGTGFVNLGSEKINSVPYALNAGNGNWDRNGANLSNSNTGNVGIGTVSPTLKLDIVGPGFTTASMGINSQNNTWDHLYLSHDGVLAGINAGGADAGLAISVGNGSTGSYGVQPYTEVLRMLPNGNVGIGTIAPNGKLAVSGTGNITSMVQTTSSGTSEARMELISGNTNWRIFSRNSDSTFGIYNGVTRLRINLASNRMSLMETGGNVGIGTSQADNALHVVASVPSGSYVSRFINAQTGLSDGIAVYAEATSGSTNYGIGMRAIGNYIGLSAQGATGGFTALRAEALGASYAGSFQGAVQVVGVLSKSSGTFKIDHPADPANKYLVHSFVESPDMMNIYNGNLQTDDNGDASVELPEYFSILNKDFRYQLTVIGSFAHAVVMDEVNESTNSFRIKTDQPNTKVSWQVTGVRKDPFANANRVVDVVEKPANEKGFYLHPELYGQSAEKQVTNRKAELNNSQVNK